MKKPLILILHALFLFLNSCTDYKEKINIMTYNIRLNTDADGINKWDNRKEGIVSLIKNENVDILGIQEALPDQIEYLSNQLKDYNYIGEGRNGGNSGEYSAIYFNSKKISLKEEETFWLSETPRFASIGWDAAINRIVTLGVFYIKNSKKELIVYNTHFDHIGKVAREKSARMILNHITKNNYQDRQLVVMGDLNSNTDELPIKVLSEKLEDSFKMSTLKDPIGTFNGFDINSKLSDRIDYVFTKNIKIIDYRHIDKKLPNGLWPSDHLPILVTY